LSAQLTVIGIFGFLARTRGCRGVPLPSMPTGQLWSVGPARAHQWASDQYCLPSEADPRRVTRCFGGRAGAVSIAVLMSSPVAKGLFKRRNNCRAAVVDRRWAGLLPAEQSRGLALVRTSPHCAGSGAERDCIAHTATSLRLRPHLLACLRSRRTHALL